MHRERKRRVRYKIVNLKTYAIEDFTQSRNRIPIRRNLLILDLANNGDIHQDFVPMRQMFILNLLEKDIKITELLRSCLGRFIFLEKQYGITSGMRKTEKPRCN